MKQCSECKKEFKSLWKAKTRDHGALCKVCWRKYKARQESRSGGTKIGNKTMYSWDKYRGRKEIKPVSDKRSKELAVYRKVRDEWMKAHPTCQAAIPGICTGKATDLHHKAGRTGRLLTATAYFLAVCRSCHAAIEVEPEWAKEHGFSVTRIDK